MAGKLFLGISGYHLTRLKEILYPRGTAPEDYLRLYAREFPALELSESDLQEIGLEGIKRCVEVTPPDFRFAIVQHVELEHSRERSIIALRESISPFVKASKLGAVVVELPNWFQYAESSRKQLAALCDNLKDVPLAINFNHGDWYRKSVIEGLRKRGVAMASVQTDSSGPAPMPAHAQATACFAYFRFAGRHIRYHVRRVNRYFEDCRYTPEQLSAWAERISSIVKWADVYVLFQHFRDASDVCSARVLRQLLQ